MHIILLSINLISVFTSALEINRPFFHMQALSLQNTLPMNYYTAFYHIAELLPKDCVIVSEGANTMDIGRTMLLNYLPRRRSFTSVRPPQFGLVCYTH